MGKAVALRRIETEISKLSLQEQLKLVERLAHHLRMTGSGTKRTLDWRKLYGLGKGLWKDEDAQQYVNRLREDRI